MSVLNLLKGGCDGDDAGVSEWMHGIQVFKRRVKGHTFYISTADVNNSGNLWSVDNGINKYSCAII